MSGTAPVLMTRCAALKALCLHSNRSGGLMVHYSATRNEPDWRSASTDDERPPACASGVAALGRGSRVTSRANAQHGDFAIHAPENSGFARPSGATRSERPQSRPDATTRVSPLFVSTAALVCLTPSSVPSVATISAAVYPALVCSTLPEQRTADYSLRARVERSLPVRPVGFR